MDLRVYAGLALALVSATANARDWLITVDVPAVVGGQLIRPDQVVELDDLAPTPLPTKATLQRR